MIVSHCNQMSEDIFTNYVMIMTNSALACNNYSCSMSRGYACAMITLRFACFAHCFTCFISLWQMRFFYVRTSWTGLYWCDSCLFVFLFAGRCEVSGDISIFVGLLCQLCCHVDRPKTMADEALQWRCQRESWQWQKWWNTCLLYTSDAADES